MYFAVPLAYGERTDKRIYNASLFGDKGVPEWLSSVSIPTLLEQSGIESRFGQAVASQLDPLIVNALAYWHEQIPPVCDDSIVSERMACLAEDWAGLAAGTLVFLRDTERARIAFILPGAIIDLAKGALRADTAAVWRFAPFAALCTPAPGHARMVHAAALAAIGGSDVKAIVDGALTAITFVGFGINGPWGLALAGAAAVAEELFNAFFNVGKPPLDQLIGEVVTRLLGKQEITDRANVVQTSLAVFKQNWNEMKTMDTRQLETLRDVAARQVQDTSDLNQAINFLSGNIAVNFMDNEEMTRRVVSLYGLAAATKLLWIKLALLLDDSPEAKGNRIKSGYLHTLITIGDEALAHIDGVTAAIEKAIADRGAQVQPCVSGSYVISIMASSSVVHCLSFQDTGDPWDDYSYITNPSHFREMVTPNQGCCQQDAQTEVCQQKRATYVAKVQGEVRDRYSYDRDAIASLRAQLAKTLDLYRPYLQH